MKILMFGWELPPFNSGGLGVACLGLTKALSAMGANVTFVLPKKVPVDADHMDVVFANEDVEITRREEVFSPYISEEEYKEKYGKLGLRGRGFQSSLFDEVEDFALRARDIARSSSFDVVHAHDWLTYGAGMAAQKVSTKPLVAHVHATEFDRTGGSSVNQLVYDVEHMGFHKADSIAAVSGFTKDTVVARYGVAPEKVHVVHNGVDQSMQVHPAIQERVSYFKNEGYKVVVFNGRLTIQKGPDYFLKAAKRVTDTCGKKIVFLFSGSGDMEKQLMKQAGDLGLSDKVFFLGFLRGEDLSALYTMADLFVMPSVSEPFGIVPLEALLHNTPVIISKQSGVSEVLSNALKVDFWDIEEMSNKIIGILEHGSLHSHLQQEGKKEVERVTWGKAAEKCMDIYTQLAGARV